MRNGIVMTLSAEDERSVERLSFYMLQEAYGAVCGLLKKVDPEMSRCMFEAVERSLESALQAIHRQQAEGGNSTRIATAIAETLVPILDDAHAATAAGSESLRPASLVKPSMAQPAMAAAA